MKIYLSVLLFFCTSCQDSAKEDLDDFFRQQHHDKYTALSKGVFVLPSVKPLNFVANAKDPFAIFLGSNQFENRCLPQEAIPELELFADQSISQLRFKGIITKESESLGLLMGKNGVLHSIKKGRVVGANRGIIDKLNANGLFITEHFRNAKGCWQKRQVQIKRG